jgi:gamma-glutamylcyclotransferase (GGCT)/AIG2-like uncharacterized protein YtfP
MELFVYGELCKPAVLRRVIGRVPVAEPALLEGYRRDLNTASGYFRARRRADAVIAGLLLAGIEAAELRRLDEFENVADGEYDRVEVEVRTLATGRSRPAWAYVMPDAR